MIDRLVDDAIYVAHHLYAVRTARALADETRKRHRRKIAAGKSDYAVRLQ